MKTGYIGNPWYVSPFYPRLGGARKEKLESPFIIVAQNPDKDYEITISWDLVPNANTYKLYINGILVDSTDLNTISYIANKNGSYIIYIRAYGEGYSSSKSNVIVIVVNSFGVFLMVGMKKLLANMKKIIIR